MADKKSKKEIPDRVAEWKKKASIYFLYHPKGWSCFPV
jgi:hypothetical protein